MTLHDAGSIGQQSRAAGAQGGVAPAAGAALAKRAFDVFAAANALTLLSPILAVTAIAIKLDSRGPVFFREAQYGYQSRAIRVLKFRASIACGEAGHNGPRLTRIGRILRRSGIEQLPQLFNVLAGDMSIVGPRPSAGRQDLIVSNFVPSLSRIKPGLIDPARTAEPLEGSRMAQRLNDNLHYAENWSLFLDIKLVMMKLFT